MKWNENLVLKMMALFLATLLWVYVTRFMK